MPQDNAPHVEKRYDLHGRRTLKATIPDELNAASIAKILNNVINGFKANRDEEQYLHDYYLGKQAILSRTKDNNENILNKVTTNFAKKIVDFRLGYEHSLSTIWVSRKDDKSNQIDAINKYEYLDEREAKNLSLYEWVLCTGHGYTMTLPNKSYKPDDGAAPYRESVIEPTSGFVVYSTAPDGEAFLNGLRASRYEYGVDGTATKKVVYGVYSTTTYYEWVFDAADLAPDFSKVIPIEKPNTLKALPLIEWKLNDSTIGVIESIIGLQDAYNTLGSNRIDAIEQLVQAYLVLLGVEPRRKKDADGNETDEYEVPTTGGTIFIPPGNGGHTPDAKFIVANLDQNSAHVLREDYRKDILFVSSLPDRQASNGGDTGIAADIRNGYPESEVNARITEKYEDSAAKKSMWLKLKICRNMVVPSQEIGDLQLEDMKPQHNRNRNDNLWTKAQVFDLLNSNNLPAHIVAKISDLFDDPGAVAIEWQAHQAELEEKYSSQLDTNDKEVLAMDKLSEPEELIVTN